MARNSATAATTKSNVVVNKRLKISFSEDGKPCMRTNSSQRANKVYSC